MEDQIEIKAPCFGREFRYGTPKILTGTRRLRLNGCAVRASWSRDESLLVVRWGSNRVAIQYVIADEKIRDFEGDLLNG